MLRTVYLVFSAFLRRLRVLLILLLSYLLQVCVVAPYMRVAGITPNLLLIVLAAIGVSLGKLHGFWCGCLYGLVLEVMQPTRPLLNLLLYPVIGLLTSALFCNKSEQRLEYERSIGKAGRDLNPWFRMFMAVAVNVLVYELVQVVYVYLREDVFTAAQVVHSLGALGLTMALAVPLMPLLRRALGFRFTLPRPRAVPYENV